MDSERRLPYTHIDFYLRMHFNISMMSCHFSEAIHLLKSELGYLLLRLGTAAKMHIASRVTFYKQKNVPPASCFHERRVSKNSLQSQAVY